MTRTALLAALLAAGPALFATEPQPPDYSRDALRRTFAMHVIELGPKPKPRVRFTFGAIEFRALGMDWRILYLPLAMPLSGTRTGVTQELPDPFALTNVALPGPRPYEIETAPRELKAELKRIERVTR